MTSSGGGEGLGLVCEPSSNLTRLWFGTMMCGVTDWVSDFGIPGSDFGFLVFGFGCWVSGFGFRGYMGFGFRDSGTRRRSPCRHSRPG